MASSVGLSDPSGDDLLHLLGAPGQVLLDGPLVDRAVGLLGEGGLVRAGVDLPVLHRQAQPVDRADGGDADHLGQVGLALLDQLVDEPRRPLDDHVLDLGHGRRRGDRVHDLAVAAELRRVELDRDVLVHGCLGDDHRQAGPAVLVQTLRGEDVVVAGGLEHGLVVGEHPEAAVVVRPRDRMLLSHLPVAADGVLGMLLGVVVEMDDGAPAGRGARVVFVSAHRHSVIMLILV